MGRGGGSTAVVHLVWPPLGRFPPERFIASYLAHPAGAEHDLVVVVNSPDGSSPELPKDLSASTAEVIVRDNSGLDIGAYFDAANRLDHDYVVFLNSHSEILDDGWAAKLVEPLTRGVGLVGASASLESHCTNISRFMVAKTKPSYWVHPRAEFRRTTRWLRDRVRTCRDFPPFPNPHVRTNAVAMRRADFVSLRVPSITGREDSHLFESGPDSLTRQVRQMAKRVGVVGRDGRFFEQEEWHASNTFRSGRQENLLIGDNRSREYDRANPEQRRQYEIRAWIGPSG